jgi:hypothetical protein
VGHNAAQWINLVSNLNLCLTRVPHIDDVGGSSDASLSCAIARAICGIEDMLAPTNDPPPRPQRLVVTLQLRIVIDIAVRFRSVGNKRSIRRPRPRNGGGALIRLGVRCLRDHEREENTQEAPCA